MGSLVAGGAIGAACGVVPALFTFGLSIPVGAVLGGAAGLCMGTVAGGTVGLVGGGAAGRWAYKHRAQQLQEDFMPLELEQHYLIGGRAVHAAGAAREHFMQLELDQRMYHDRQVLQEVTGAEQLQVVVRSLSGDIIWGPAECSQSMRVKQLLLTVANATRLSLRREVRL